MDLLRFITAGSVDDGKSTLIGRLLYDSKSILADQLEALQKQTKNKDQGAIDLALLTDGLRAEREQGITIDVAYKYFSTPLRKFIVADAPGHLQYTRNMITGASNAALIIILVDARLGVVEQTRRHSIIASLLKIPNIVVAINKMDLVAYAEERFDEIARDYAKVATSLALENVTYIPISALHGDNIVSKSDQLSWYSGPSLLHLLEHIPLDNTINLVDTRFPVQYVIRPQTSEWPDYRGYAGKITSGIFKKGDDVTVLPSGLSTKIKALETGGQEITEAFAPQSVTMLLEDDIDVSRGDMIVKQGSEPQIAQQVEVLLAWMDTKPLVAGKRYLLQINSCTVPAIVKEILYRLDVNTLEQEPYPTQVSFNEVVKATIKTASPIVFDAYGKNRHTGAAILIDETSFLTVGAVLLQ